MPTLSFELLAHGFLNRGVANYSLFRGANGSVIETLPGEDILHGLGHVRRSFNEYRNITRTNSEGRFGGRVSRSYQANAAGCQHDGRLLVLHQGFRAFDGCECHAPDG